MISSVSRISKIKKVLCFIAKFLQKIFYNRETISFTKISTLAESSFTLSWSAEKLELRKGFSIWVA